MIPASALIDDPVQCPACGQPLNPFEDWRKLAVSMPCCRVGLSVARTEALVEAADVEVKRRQGEWARYDTAAAEASRETGRG